jgi:hypothetical protein
VSIPKQHFVDRATQAERDKKNLSSAAIHELADHGWINGHLSLLLSFEGVMESRLWGRAALAAIPLTLSPGGFALTISRLADTSGWLLVVNYSILLVGLISWIIAIVFLCHAVQPWKSADPHRLPDLIGRLNEKPDGTVSSSSRELALISAIWTEVLDQQRLFNRKAHLNAKRALFWSIVTVALVSLSVTVASFGAHFGTETW